jgi:hypothetical protein
MAGSSVESKISVLRPHHLLDILSDFGHGVRHQPHPYGHALHSVADRIFSDLDQEVLFVIAADDVCRPCRHLRPDGKCDDVLHPPSAIASKQAYNDALDRRLWGYLGLAASQRMSVREFLLRVDRSLPGLEEICTHPGEDQDDRRIGLQKGLNLAGIRQE